MNSPNLHHIVWDGGPDLKIRFDSNISGSFAYVQNLNSDWHIVYRTQTYCSPGANGARGFQVGSSRSVDHVSFINNEFHSCESVGDQTSSVYVGAGSNGGYTNFLFQNNIVRGMYGEGIEINPRVTSSNATIIGNAFHDVGLGTCSTPWKCRPAITMSIQSGGGNNGTVIANNMIWNTGSSCIYDRGGGNPRPLIQNNTCFNHGMGTMPGGQNNPQGITGYSSGGTATVQNNIIYSPSGIAPFDASAFSASNNLCAPGASCGSAKQSYSAATFLSTDPNSPLFLQIGPGSEARNKGMPIAGVSGSYNGVPRPQEGAHDIGAHELASGDTTAPVVPGGLKVLR